MQNELKAEEEEEDFQEVDADAIRVAGQLKELEKPERPDEANQVMHLVEVSSVWLGSLLDLNEG